MLTELGPDPSRNPNSFLKVHPKAALLEKGTDKASDSEDTMLFQQNYGFLFRGYHCETYYWEVVVIARKACLSLVGVVFAFDARMQVNMGLLVLMSATFAHLAYQPFTTDIMNMFELVSLSTSLLTFFFGIFTMDAAEDGEFSIASVLAVLLNLGYLAVVREVHKRIKQYTLLEKESPEDIEDRLGENMIELMSMGENQKDPCPPPEGSDTDEDESDSKEHSVIATHTVNPQPPSPPEDTDSSSGSDSDQNPVRASPPLELDLSSDSSSSDDEANDAPRNNIQLVETRKAWQANKPEHQMSFGEGDIIRVVKETGKWDLGVLFLSDAHEITNKAKYYPANFVTKVDVEDMAELLQARKERDQAAKEREERKSQETDSSDDSDSE